MELQDKIGRDLAKDLLDRFEHIHRGDPHRMSIFEGTKMYKFFLNSNLQDFGRKKRTKSTGRIILPMELDKQLAAGVITEEEHKNVLNMLESSNDGDFTIAEGIINLKRQERLKKRKK